MWGGYYFDTDMEMTSKPPKIIDISFVSAIYNETISTSFIASTAQHPVLTYYIKRLHTYFQGRISDHCEFIEKNKIMGSCLLWEAYNEATEAERGNPYLIE